MRFELEPYHRDTPSEELLNELRRVAEKLKRKTVTIDEFNEHAKFHSTTLSRRFGTWLKALSAAGLEKSRNLHLTNEQLFENLVVLWLKIGSQPRYNHLATNDSQYSAGTYEKRFGSWRKALEAFVSWANDEPAELVSSSKAVIEVKASHKTSRNINWRLRALVLMRDGARCQLCGAEARNGAQLHVDHIWPWNKGGETVLENLQILCSICNIGKSDVTPDAYCSK